TGGDGTSALDTLTCETCGEPLLDCNAPESARQVLQLARSGKLAPRPIVTARADAKGHFRFPQVPAAELQVHARAPGFGDGSTYAEGRTPSAEGDDEVTGVVVALSAIERVQVTVVDEDEKPVRGATVSILDREAGTVR